MFSDDYRVRLTGNCYLMNSDLTKAIFDYVASGVPGTLCKEVKREDCAFDLVVVVKLRRSYPGE